MPDNAWMEDEFVFSDLEDPHTSSDDDSSAPPQAVIINDPEVWMDYYSDELLDLYHSLQDQCTSRGFAVLDACTFPDFAQFCFRFSSGYPPPV